MLAWGSSSSPGPLQADCQDERLQRPARRLARGMRTVWATTMKLTPRKTYAMSAQNAYHAIARQHEREQC